MVLQMPTDSESQIQSDRKIELLEQYPRDLADASEKVRQQTLTQTNARIDALEQKALQLARFVETTRQQTLLQSDLKAEALEQKARDLAHSVEELRNQTRLQNDAEIEALGQKARDLALAVEAVRKDTRMHSEQEIAALNQQARDLAACVESEREETHCQSESEIRELEQQARHLAVSVEASRLETLIESDRVIRELNDELEQRVLERTAQLESANKELESFSYSVSHDLRAPLRAIDGFSRIILEEHAAYLPDAGKAYLNLVRDNTRQMGQLIDDLLAFSRLGRLALTKQAVDPDKIVRVCLAEMQTEREGRQLEINIGDLSFCEADPTLLKQVWTNLLSNALKYTRNRGTAQIEIGCKIQPRLSPDGEKFQSLSDLDMQTVYFVSDNGAGFDMKYVHKLFGVFQRLHRASDYEGTGVGLAIVQRIINRHGGRIWAEARLNKGASFFFTLD